MSAAPAQRRYPFGIPYGWFQVAWSSELEPGDVLARYYFGRHLVLWRDEEGTAHLNDAFCPHLGAHFGYGGVVEGCELGARSTAGSSTARAPTPTSPTAPARTRRPASARTRSQEASAITSSWRGTTPTASPPPYDFEDVPEMTSDDYSARPPCTSCWPRLQELAENSVDGPTSATCTTPRSSRDPVATRPRATRRSCGRSSSSPRPAAWSTAASTSTTTARASGSPASAASSTRS